MALPTPRTLGDLRGELRDRLGFAAQGSQGGPSVGALNSYLRTAQVQLYWAANWKDLVVLTPDSFKTSKNQRFYDWPDDCEPRKIISVQGEDITTAENPSVWPLVEGIDWPHDGSRSPTGNPARYERRAKLEIWPIPHRSGIILRLEYVKRLERFTMDADFATVDSDLIFLHALASAKAHYKHQDASVYGDQLRSLLAAMKAGDHGQKRYIRGQKADEIDPLQRPVNTLDLPGGTGFGTGFGESFGG